MNRVFHTLLLILVLLIYSINTLYAYNTNNSINSSFNPVTLKTPYTEAKVGEIICIPINVKNFNNIASFQFALTWDINILELSEIKLTNIADIKFNDAQLLNGLLRLLWFDSESSPLTLIDDSSLLELCFFVQGATEVGTELNITGFQDFEIEISTIDNPIEYAIETGTIVIKNLLDCVMVPPCEEKLTMDFVEGRTITPNDILTDIQFFKDCYGYDDDQLYLLNMSEQEAKPQKSITINCQNLYQPTYFGVFVLENGAFAPIDNYYLSCKTAVHWNIPEANSNCVQQDRSCIDPTRCKNISIALDSNFTEILYRDIIDLPNPDLCELEYGTQFPNSTSASNIEADGFYLTCLDYSEKLRIPIALVHYLQDGSQVVMFEWCYSEINLQDIEEVCSRKEILDGDIPIRIVNEKQVNLLLNDNRLTKNSTYEHVIKATQLIGGISNLKIESNWPLIENISTFDLVMLYEMIVNEKSTAAMAIAGDVDLSGSLTTKDLLIHRNAVLGIESQKFIGEPFMIEKSRDLSKLNQFDFENSFQHYQIEKGNITIAGLDFEVFKYGDISGAESQFHKSNHTRINDISLYLQNQFVKKGDRVSMPISLQDDILYMAASISLNFKGLHITSIEHEYPGNVLQSYQPDYENINLSFFTPNKPSSFELILNMEALTDGYIKDMIKLTNSVVPEAVTDIMSVGNIKMNWSENQKNLVKESFCYYPNPTNDLVYLEIPEKYIGGQLDILNPLGKYVNHSIIDNMKMQLPLSQYESASILFIRISKEGFSETVRIIIED